MLTFQLRLKSSSERSV